MLTRIDLAVDTPTAGVPGTPVVARIAGSPDAADADDLTEKLAGMLREHERLVAEVSGLETSDEAVALALPAAMEAAGGWPEARLVLAAPRPALQDALAATHADRRLMVCPDLTSAAEHLDRRPPLVRALWDFTVTPSAPGSARGYVRAVCAAWDVDDEAREAAEIVVTELVTNAVEHATSASRVDVERSDQAFRLSVRDWDTATLPPASLPSASATRGRGLAMVAAVSRAWGVETHTDGKTVWAEMATAAS